MTKDEQNFLDRINQYAATVLDDIDPQKVQVSLQLEKLRPVMEELAKEENCSIEEIFIKYMDLASTQGVNTEAKFQASINNPKDYMELRL